MIALIFLFFSTLNYDQYILPRIALAACCLAYAWGRKENRWGAKPLTAPMLALLAAVAASAFASGDLFVNVFGRLMGRYFALVPLALCVLAYHLPARRVHAQMRWAGGLMAIYALLQLVWNPLPYTVLSSGGRVAGTLGSPPTSGAALAMCLPFCYGRTPRRAILTALTMAALLATGSRGPLLGAVVASAILGWPDRRDLIGARLAAALLACAALLVVFNHSTSDVIRVLTWKTSLRVFAAHPVFGAGGESFVDSWRAFRGASWISLVGPLTMQDNAHNDLLQALASFGAVGAAAYSWLLWRTLGVFRGIRRLGWVGAENRAIVASIAALFVCAKFNAPPFACLFAAALLLGSLDCATPARFTRWGPTAAAVVMAGCLGALVVADGMFYRARRVMDFNGMLAASKVNPFELTYQAHEADVLTRKWLATGEHEAIGWALFISREAVARHPRSVQAQHMLTQTLLLLAKTEPGYLKEAYGQAVKLNGMDPYLNFKFRVVQLPKIVQSRKPEEHNDP